MVTLSVVKIPHGPIAEFRRRHGVRRLSLFGSVLRNDFGSDSDIDVLVEFEPGRRVRPRFFVMECVVSECRRHGAKLAQRFNAGN